MPNLSGSISLSLIVDRFILEIEKIEMIFDSCANHEAVPGYRFDYKPTEDGCLVSLWDAWNRFIRNLVITSASGRAIGIDHVSYRPPIPRSEEEVLSDLASNARGNNFGIYKGEPKWTNPLCLVSIVDFLDLPNKEFITINVGCSDVLLSNILVPNPVEEIRLCRNFVAHKGAHTLQLIEGEFGRVPFVSLTSHVRDLRLGGIKTFSEWKECLIEISKLASK